MIYPIPPKPEWLRALAAWCGPTLACLLLAGCVTSGETPSPTASDQNALPKAEPAVARSTDTLPGTGSTGLVPAGPELLLRRRQAFAEMLEGTLPYRTILDVKLMDAKLAGPFPYVIKSWFSSTTSTQTLYCVSAKLDIWPFPVPRMAVIRVVPTGGGSERYLARIELKYTPPECNSANYEPFPELEQARAKRRQALGKAD